MPLSFRVIGCCLLAFFVVLLTILTATRLPQPIGNLEVQDGWLYYKQQNQTGNATRIDAFQCVGKTVVVDAGLATEEPDTLENFAAFNQLMTDHRCLTDGISLDNKIAFTDENDRSGIIELRPRQLADLPAEFWMQIAIAIIALLIGLIIWAAKPGVTTGFYLATGVFLTVSITAASIYSTRAFFIDGELFRRLSNINQLGSNFFTASLAALLWNYPRKLGPQWVSGACFLMSLTFCVAYWFQLTESPQITYLGILSVYSFSFVFAFMQWRLTRNEPVERAALLWFLLSIFLGTGLFAGLQLVPVALGVDPVASQAPLFAVFLFMYVGLAGGLLKYRLFDIGRWWFKIWSWLLGGIAILAVDALLLSFTALNKTAALSFSLALIGWVYFPVRQWFWARAMRPKNKSPQHVLNNVIPLFVGTRNKAELQHHWQRTLQAAFRPLHMNLIESASTPSVSSSGRSLRVGSRLGDQGFELSGPDEGRRLFNRDDIALAKLLQSQFDLAEHGLKAREEGRHAERDRIREDIHDDLGAHLLQLLHRSNDEQRPLVKQAIADLRKLIDALDDVSQPLMDLLQQMEREARTRCEDNAIKLSWQQTLSQPGKLIAPEPLLGLQRITRELVSNAIRHAQPSVIDVEINQPDASSLTLVISNDGTIDRDFQEGIGSRTTRKRAADLNGNIETKIEAKKWTSIVTITLADYTPWESSS